MPRLIKISDLIVRFFEDKGIKNVFLLSGGMMMNLLDSLSKSSKITYVCNHHEQASAIAAEAYARVNNSVGVCYATSGPGATNTITGIAGAWLDSSPVMFLTGQSRTGITVRGSGISNLRMYGNFEVDISKIVEPITKYSVFLNNPNDIFYELEKSYYLATSNRPGPVLLDVPLDIQATIVDEDNLNHFSIPKKKKINFDFNYVKSELENSHKAIVLAGNGIRVSNQVKEFISFIYDIQIPIVTTQLANDLIAYNDNLYIGKVGLRGDRAGNYAVQNADLIIVIGSSLHITTTGYDLDKFAPEAKKIIIDIDDAILEKNKNISQLQIKSDIKTFLETLKGKVKPLKSNDWIKVLTNWKNSFRVVDEPHHFNNDKINTYQLVNELSNSLIGNEIVITDSGSLYYIMGQAFLTKKNQRVIVSGGLGAMGYALPASIGASFAEPNKNIFCITGDGSAQLNIQELQTISHHKLNCKLLIINNNGYASIRNSQSAFLNGHLAGCSENTGVSFPNWKKLSSSYSIPYKSIDKPCEIKSMLKDLINTKGPFFVEIFVPENVKMLPSVTSTRLEDGTFESNQLQNMSPKISENTQRNISEI